MRKVYPRLNMTLYAVYTGVDTWDGHKVAAAKLEGVHTSRRAADQQRLAIKRTGDIRHVIVVPYLIERVAAKGRPARKKHSPEKTWHHWLMAD